MKLLFNDCVRVAAQQSVGGNYFDGVAGISSTGVSLCDCVAGTCSPTLTPTAVPTHSPTAPTAAPTPAPITPSSSSSGESNTLTSEEKIGLGVGLGVLVAGIVAVGVVALDAHYRRVSEPVVVMPTSVTAV